LYSKLRTPGILRYDPGILIAERMPTAIGTSNPASSRFSLLAGINRIYDLSFAVGCGGAPVTEGDLRDIEEGRKAVAEGRVKSWD